MDEEAIFAAAIECKSPAERAAFLDGACGSDQQLRSQVDALLRSHEEAGTFLNEPAAPSRTLDQPIIEKPGTQIGPYKLLQQLGEGGMGVVYMAEQKEPVKRRVALKIIKPGMDTRQVIARFEAERQALAMMDHPNIAKVLDAGATESGRPYFVMELVNGLPVTKYCDEQHLTPKERLELFVPICQAVQHAHQKGIIHRDLKPSNILVALYDGKPVPKIIDFGVAKATSQTLTEKTMFTQLGQVVGTLEYMSPEQAERNQLDIDTRSDIYSLGVVLYELLTGDTPFDRKRLCSAAFDEMLRIIREEEPSKPSTKVSSSQSLPSIAAHRRIEPAKLGSMIRGELDWIVMKALEKDRSRRYETASAFAADVQHYLNDEAVVACPPSAGYRLRKFVRRNKAALLATMLVGCALLVAVAGIMGGVGWAVRDRAAQQAAAEREKTERQGRITTHVELLLSDVDRLAQEQRWDEALAVAKRAEVAIASDAVEAAVNEKVRSVLRELEFVARLSEIRMEIATVDGNSFNHAGAAENYRQAFRDFGVDLDSSAANAAVFQLKRSPRIILPVAEALDELVNHRRKSATSRAGTANLGSLIDITRGLDPDPVRNQLRATWGRKVTPELQAELQRIVESFDPRLQGPLTATRLADTLGWAGRSDLEEQVLRKAQEEFPGDYWINLRFGVVLIAHNEPAEAAKFFCVARAIKPDSVAALSDLGGALSRQGRLEEAIACYRKAIELEPRYVLAHNNLGGALSRQGRLEEAIACYRHALELAPQFAMAYDNLGGALYRQGKLDEAIESFRKTIELDPKIALAHYSLGLGLAEKGKLDEAIACYRQAIELDPKYATAYINLGVALGKQGKLEDAISCYRKAIENDPKLALAHHNLGVALKNQGNLDEAIACWQRAIEIDPPWSGSYFILVATHQEHNDRSMAIEVLRQSFNWFSRQVQLSPDDTEAFQNLSKASVQLTHSLREIGRADEAVPFLDRARELNVSGRSFWMEYALSYRVLGRTTEYE